jgi:phosphatidate phosphatase APP1
MSSWKDVLHKLGHNAEEAVDGAILRLKQRFNLFDPLQILPYHGYGTPQEIFMKGRLLEEREIMQLEDQDTVWKNILNMYQRFRSEEIPDARLRAQFYDTFQEVVTDNEGFFNLHFQPNSPPPTDHPWHDISLELLESMVEEQGPLQKTGKVLIPPSSSQFAVVSDIDDTIMISNADNFIQFARLTLLNNARSRAPFAGVGAFYRALQRGAKAPTFNPIFYLSSNAWNLYDFLIAVMETHDIPVGPLFLRDLGIDETKFIKAGHQAHKGEQIRHLMEIYPNLPFILIGDSGQKDAEIYRQAVYDSPERVAAIYIRDVTEQQRDDEVHRLAEEVRSQGVDMLLVEDTEAAAEHAAAHGFIDQDALPEIRGDKARDQGEPSAEEQAVA